MAGTMHPEEVLNPHTMTLFLRAPSDHPRNRLRTELTHKAFMLEGMNADFADARGSTPLAHMWTLILFGDYVPGEKLNITITGRESFHLRGTVAKGSSSSG